MGWEAGYQLGNVSDQGPNHGKYYIFAATVATACETVINKYIKAGGPLPDPSAPRNWYDQNTGPSGLNCFGTPGSPGPGSLFVERIKMHENLGFTTAPNGGGSGHQGQLKHAVEVLGNDPRKAIEDNIADSEQTLKSATNIELGTVDASLGAFRGNHLNIDGFNWTPSVPVSIWTGGGYGGCGAVIWTGQQ
jgi:hypothetical protein